MEKSGTRVRIRSQLNISLESEHLNPEEIKAHEADTLPMALGNVPGDDKRGEGEEKVKKKKGDIRQRKKELCDKLHGFAAPFLAEENPLPQSPTTKDKVLQGY